MELSKTYSPNEYEPSIYGLWEAAGAFVPGSSKSSDKSEPFSIIMPPANANGNLHVGHALTIALEDILARFYRMKGRDVIYIPGEDHAGLETWTVFERELEKKKQSRFDFSREQIYSQIWDFVQMHRSQTELQIRALGASVSWDNLTFTLDEKVIDRTFLTFKKMWDDGLIYRGERIVNYSTKYQTGYSDIEVDHREEKGTLWKIAYPLLDQIGEIIIATTRPETMLGDVAIAVHPDDVRYKHLIGTRVLLPLCERELPIIADSYVDPKFGTGAVKITPAHDPNDFEMAKRHNLPRLQVIDFDGRMINAPSQFVGLNVDEARKRILASLKAAEYLRGEESITHSIGYDYKSGLPIQPLIKEQWFMRMQPLAKRAIEAIQADEIMFYPASKKSAIVNYFESIHDWNLSRQIPWGIPIPAFRNQNNRDDWIFDDRVEEKQIVVDGATYIREEDTFDTWFSSGQWPFVTTDFTENGDLAKYFPLSVLETGGDILYAWVARMIMLSLYVTGHVPFKDVYLHGLVLDEHNQKMSKSKGNVINPIETVAEYGSDALRFGLISNRSAGQNQAFSTDRVIAGRNFCNKLWNIARFTQNLLPGNFIPTSPHPVSIADHWIVGRLAQTARSVESLLGQYRFAEAAELVYHTIWDDVADWYVEIQKGSTSVESFTMLAYVLETCLKIAHPFLPFITETIWQSLPWRDNLVTLARWPTAIKHNTIAAHEFIQLQSLINEIRYVVNELPTTKKYCLIYGEDSLIEDNAALITRLTRLESVDTTDQPRGLRIASSNREAWLDLDEDTLYEHQTNLEVRLAKAREETNLLQQRLASSSYVAKAPAKLVEESRHLLAERQAQIERLSNELTIL